MERYAGASGEGGVEGGEREAVSVYRRGVELLASPPCFVATTANELVNGEFTASACGPIKPGDGADDGNDGTFFSSSASSCVCVMRMRRGVLGGHSDKGGRKVEGAAN